MIIQKNYVSQKKRRLLERIVFILKKSNKGNQREIKVLLEESEGSKWKLNCSLEVNVDDGPIDKSIGPNPEN